MVAAQVLIGYFHRKVRKGQVKVEDIAHALHPSHNKRFKGLVTTVMVGLSAKTWSQRQSETSLRQDSSDKVPAQNSVENSKACSIQ